MLVVMPVGETQPVSSLHHGGVIQMADSLARKPE